MGHRDDNPAPERGEPGPVPAEASHRTPGRAFLKTYLIRQLDTAWKLTSFHLDGLTTEECLWRPALAGPQVRQLPSGEWQADWPEHERYDLGPPSIAWITWHIGFWWSMALDHSFGEGTLSREKVIWPGSADAVREWVGALHGAWREKLEQLTAADLQSTERTRWPFRDRPFGDLIAWVNVELTKNAAEIGYARFLHAVQSLRTPATPSRSSNRSDG